MTGKILLCLLYSFYNDYTDWKTYRLHNRAFLVFFALGLAVNAFLGGLQGVKEALLGGAFMLLLLPLFALRFMGAGDIKELMGVGAMIGFPDAAWSLAFSLIAAGVLAVVLIVRRGNARKRFRHLWEYLKACWFTRSVLAYPEEARQKDGLLRFSFAITGGLLIQLVTWLASNAG